MKHLSPTFLALLTTVTCLSLTTQAQNTLISGDIGTASNWDDNVVPTNPLDPGVIDSSNTGANEGTINANKADGLYVNLEIIQSGGDVARTSFGSSYFDNVNYEMTGGTFTNTSLGHEWDNSTVTVSNGSLHFASFTARNGTFDMSGGTLTTNNDLNSQGGQVFNFSGGTINIGRDAMRGFQPTTSYNFSGTADFNVTRNFGEIDAGVRSVNLLAGSGTVDIGGDLEADGMTIDWTSGSGYTITATALLDNGVSTTWDALWTAGQLTVDGGQTGTFNDNFIVAGNTLSLVPEPSTYVLIAGSLVLGVAMWRRRRA